LTPVLRAVPCRRRRGGAARAAFPYAHWPAHHDCAL